MATPGQLQMYNKMEVGEMFGLDHRAYDSRYGQIRRVQIWPDENVPDAVVFKIWLEDHTLGNLLRMELLRDETVLFVGYKVPHPLDHMIELRVQTLPQSNPETAIRQAIRNLRGEVKSMLEQFDTGLNALHKGERHAPEEPARGGGLSMTELEGMTSDGGSLECAEAGAGTGLGVSPALSPSDVSPGDMISPGLTPGGETPGPDLSASMTPGLTPGGSTPGPDLSASMTTPGLTPGGDTPGLDGNMATPGLTPGGDTPGPEVNMATPGLTPGGDTPGPVATPHAADADGDVDMG